MSARFLPDRRMPRDRPFDTGILLSLLVGTALVILPSRPCPDYPAALAATVASSPPERPQRLRIFHPGVSLSSTCREASQSRPATRSDAASMTAGHRIAGDHLRFIVA